MNKCSCGVSGPVAPIGCDFFGSHMRGDLGEWDDWKYWGHRELAVRVFRLWRDGRIVATGVVLPTGRTVLEWRLPRPSVGIYADFDEFRSIHVHGHERTHVRWCDGTDGEQLGFTDPFAPEQINAALRQAGKEQA